MSTSLGILKARKQDAVQETKAILSEVKSQSIFGSDQVPFWAANWPSEHMKHMRLMIWYSTHVYTNKMESNGLPVYVISVRETSIDFFNLIETEEYYWNYANV